MFHSLTFLLSYNRVKQRCYLKDASAMDNVGDDEDIDSAPKGCADQSCVTKVSLYMSPFNLYGRQVQQDSIKKINNFSLKNTKTDGSLQVTLLEMICSSQFLEYQMQQTVKQFVQKSTGTWFSKISLRIYCLIKLEKSNKSC